jgi:hypothetical protein
MPIRKGVAHRSLAPERLESAGAGGNLLQSGAHAGDQNNTGKMSHISSVGLTFTDHGKPLKRLLLREAAVSRASSGGLRRGGKLKFRMRSGRGRKSPFRLNCCLPFL